MSTIVPLLMFSGQAEEAMNLYVSVFDGSSVDSITRYGAEGPGAEGSVKQAVFTLKGQTFRCMDSMVSHPFTFTPSISLYAACATEDELDRTFAALAEGGSILMPLAAYPFSPKFGWVTDRFGVSWQLNLEK